MTPPGETTEWVSVKAAGAALSSNSRLPAPSSTG
ncbi:Uncharacterised protein [Acinetobacter baumannii]|nr:Uncharacterised protein [Acinetobacter baumannii]